MATHTPGPWSIIGEDDLPDHDDLVVVAFDVSAPETDEQPPGIFICNIGSNGGQYGALAPVEAGDKWPVSLANARLIAAAPGLLDACEVALADRLRTHHGDDHMLQALHQAIAEARGG